jgi:hypothetical protein
MPLDRRAFRPDYAIRSVTDSVFALNLGRKLAVTPNRSCSAERNQIALIGLYIRSAVPLYSRHNKTVKIIGQSES